MVKALAFTIITCSVQKRRPAVYQFAFFEAALLDTFSGQRGCGLVMAGATRSRTNITLSASPAKNLTRITVFKAKGIFA
ncbi:hypothetical protein [Oceanimonas marisflavi]|uniref:hypothetical protein n=1 Tax=Oceanimonas marisflavi TaxID=2059724 RepID=UPI0018E4FC00|nr:hypothetical protein [Oceanimonas marisflavi]